jgi:hypothetical protein
MLLLSFQWYHFSIVHRLETSGSSFADRSAMKSSLSELAGGAVDIPVMLEVRNTLENDRYIIW